MDIKFYTNGNKECKIIKKILKKSGIKYKEVDYTKSSPRSSMSMLPPPSVVIDGEKFNTSKEIKERLKNG